MTDQPKCSTCRFYLSGGRRVSGQCRRHPPAAFFVADRANPLSCWPEAFDDDWCGEHEEAPATSEPQEPNRWWDPGVRGRRALLVTKMTDAEVLNIDPGTFRGAERLLDVHGVGETTIREIVMKCREAHGMTPHDES